MADRAIFYEEFLVSRSLFHGLAAHCKSIVCWTRKQFTLSGTLPDFPLPRHLWLRNGVRARHEFHEWGEHPIETVARQWYFSFMNMLLLIVVLLLLFGGGGFYLGGPVVGGGGLGLILVICLVVYLSGGFRART